MEVPVASLKKSSGFYVEGMSFNDGKPERK
jgi:hypothetical protein